MLETSFSRLRDRFGARSPSALACRLNRAANMLALGDHGMAAAEISLVAVAYEETLGSDHPFRFVCLSNLSATLREGGSEDRLRAREVAELATAGCLKTLGGRHPHSLAAAMNHASSRFETDDLDGLPEQMSTLGQTMIDVLGSWHPDVLTFRANLAVMRSVSSPMRSITEKYLEEGEKTAIDKLADRLGSDQHPAVRALRAGKLVYRVIDLQDPF